MKQTTQDQAKRELDQGPRDEELYALCLAKAENDETRAREIYLLRRRAELAPEREDLDRREKWPMLAPLLVLYTLGTIGVLFLVFGFLAGRLGWW